MECANSSEQESSTESSELSCEDDCTYDEMTTTRLIKIIKNKYFANVDVQFDHNFCDSVPNNYLAYCWVTVKFII